MDISEILIHNREQIIRDWVKKLHKGVSPTYSAQPMEEIHRTVSAVFDANLAVIADDDFRKINAFIEWIGRIRSKQGFSLSEVQKAFELYGALLLPILARRLHVEDFIPAMKQVNDCLAYTIHKFSDHFQELHEAKIREYAKTLEVKVDRRTRQLAESESKYRTLVEKIEDGYFVTRKGSVLFANKAFCAMHGYEKKDVIGRKFDDFVASESRRMIPRMSEEKGKTGGLREPHVYFRLHHSGTSLPTESTITVADYQGKMSVIGICRDITERMEIERRVREAESLARIGRVTTSLAHEIRNPLSSAKMSIQMILKNTVYEGTDRRRLEILSQQVSRLEKIVTEMLDPARPMQLQLKRTIFPEVLDNSLEALDARIRERRIHVEKAFPKDLPLIIIDREKMEQVMINLLLNAIEAADHCGNISITAQHLREVQALKLNIEDDGCGVSPEDLPSIFDPFFSKKARGTGLGLANARQIIEAHKGSIKAFSGKDKGMNFTLVLPLDPEQSRTVKGSS